MHVRSLSLALALLAWIINPAFVLGCGGEEADFTFGEADLIVLMESLNADPWDVSTDAGSYQLDLDLRQGASVEVTRAPTSGLLIAAYACGNREFVSSASACMDQTFLGLEGQVTISDASSGDQVGSPIEVEGVMEVMGLNLTDARVTLNHGGGEFVFVSNDGVGFSLEEANW